MDAAKLRSKIEWWSTVAAEQGRPRHLLPTILPLLHPSLLHSFASNAFKEVPSILVKGVERERESVGVSQMMVNRPER